MSHDVLADGGEWIAANGLTHLKIKLAGALAPELLDATAYEAHVASEAH